MARVRSSGNLVALLDQDDLVDEPGDLRVARRDPRGIHASQLALKDLQEGHEVPNRENVMLHEDAKARLVPQISINRVGQKPGAHRRDLVFKPLKLWVHALMVHPTSPRVEWAPKTARQSKPWQTEGPAHIHKYYINLRLPGVHWRERAANPFARPHRLEDRGSDLVLHGLALAGLFYFPLTWKAVSLVLFSHYLRMWWLTTFSHRYFSHRSFKTSRGFQCLMALGSTLTTQNEISGGPATTGTTIGTRPAAGSPFTQTKRDLVGPYGLGAFISFQRDQMGRAARPLRVPRAAVAQSPLAGHQFAAMAACGLLFGSATLYCSGSWGRSSFSTARSRSTRSRTCGAAGATIRTTRAATTWCCPDTLGEGWHNNHHHYPSSARQGFFWWEIDPSFYILKGLGLVGLVWDIGSPRRAFSPPPRSPRSPNPRPFRKPNGAPSGGSHSP